jgi:protein-S-isoprenylcysteine O-methyltransferase Ste14
LAAVFAAEALGRRGRLLWPGGLVWPVVAGLVLMAAGIGLRAWSIVTLGRFFQYQIKVQPGHRVVTSGPYR